MASLLDRLYQRLPVWGQDLACSFYGWRESRIRYSSVFFERLGNLVDSDRWPADRIRGYQDLQVARVVREACATVPFWRERLARHGVVPDDIRGVSDLVKLPVLTKEEVRAHGAALVAPALRANALTSYTSGSTGTPLTVWSTPDAVAFQWAVWWRFRGRFGCRPGDWFLQTTGRPVAPLTQTSPPYWRTNHFGHQWLAGSVHITPSKVRDLTGFLARIRPRFWCGYPSHYGALSRLALDAGLELPPAARPPMVFLGAEPLLGAQAANIAEWTGARLAEQYGMTEMAGNASQCEQGVFHEDFEMGYIEAHEPEPAGSGTRSRLLLTGFINPAMPLIRYEVGDVGVFAPHGHSCPCGRASRVLTSIDGRYEDGLITPEGLRVRRVDSIFMDTRNLREAQVVQREPGAIVVRVAVTPAWSSVDSDALRARVAELLSPTLRVHIEVVDTIAREAGKFRAVRSCFES